MKRDSQFKLSYFLSANEVFHIARVNITSSQDLSLHTHDYAEILWIEKGTGYHHVNGRQVRLSAGDMVMIRFFGDGARDHPGQHRIPDRND